MYSWFILDRPPNEGKLPGCGELGLSLEHPPRILITLITVLRNAHFLQSGDPLRLSNGSLLLVLLVEHQPQDTDNGDIDDQIRQRHTVTHVVPRTPFRAIQLRAHHGAQVADGDLHGIGDGALGLARDIVGGPREDDGRGRIDAGRGEEDAHVRTAGAVRAGG